MLASAVILAPVSSVGTVPRRVALSVLPSWRLLPDAPHTCAKTTLTSTHMLTIGHGLPPMVVPCSKVWQCPLLSCRLSASPWTGRNPIVGRQTKVHKILQCPALEAVRRPHQAFLAYALENWPHWCHGPFAVMPPHTEVNRLIFHTRALPPPLPLPPALDLPGPRGFLRLFTDGSCQHPTLPLASRASFSVVVDTTTTDAEIPSLLAAWRNDGVLPPSFRVHCIGLVPGEQNIHRAELCAILQAARIADCCGCPAEIWADSQVAINEWDRICQSLPALWPDISLGFQGLSLQGVRVRKIAAHQNLQALCGLEQWCAAGNDVSLSLEFDLVKTHSDETAEWLTAQRDALWLFWRFLLELSKEEMRLLRAHNNELAKEDAPDVPANSTGQIELVATTALTNWMLQQEGPWISLAVPPVRREVLLACSWPPWFTYAIWSWARRLESVKELAAPKSGLPMWSCLFASSTRLEWCPRCRWKRPNYCKRPHGLSWNQSVCEVLHRTW